MMEVGQWFEFDTRLYVRMSNYQFEIGDKVEIIEVSGQWLIVPLFFCSLRENNLEHSFKNIVILSSIHGCQQATEIPAISRF